MPLEKIRFIRNRFLLIEKKHIDEEMHCVVGEGALACHLSYGGLFMAPLPVSAGGTINSPQLFNIIRSSWQQWLIALVSSLHLGSI